MNKKPQAGSLWRLSEMRRLIMITLLGFSSFCLTLAAVPSWAVSGGVGEASAGLVTTVMLASTVLTQSAVPALVARIGIGPTLGCGLFALGAPAPLYAASQSLGSLLSISAVRGSGFAVLTVVGAILVSGLAPPGRQGESVGLYGLATSVPNLAAVPAGVAMTQANAFPVVAFLAAAPVLAIPAAISIGRVPSTGQATVVSSAVGTHRGAAWAALAPSLVLLLVTLAGGGLLTFLPIARPSGLSATLALLVFGSAATVVRWRVGAVADQIGTRLLLPAAVVAAVVGMVVVAAGLLDSSAYAVLITGAALFGIGYGAVQSLSLLVAFTRAGESGTSTASAVWNIAFDTGIGVGALAVGAVAATGLGLPWAFVASAAAMSLSLPLALQTGQARHSPQAHAD